jgi:hypothetical protein
MAVEQSVERGRIKGSATFVGRAHTLAGPLIVAGVVLLSMVVHYALSLQQTAPWIMGDELRYSDMAKSFIEEGRLLVREGETPFATAYPVLIAPAWLAGDVATAYEMARAINVVLMTMSALVAFLWARRLVSTRYALVAGGLVLLMPTFAYTGTLMTENAALPGFLLAAFVIARTLEQPTLRWQLAAFAAITLAALLRVQVGTLAIVYPTAILLHALFTWRAGAASLLASLRRFAVSFGILLAGAVVYAAYKLLAGASLTSGLGAYAVVGQVDYDTGKVARWSLWHAGELVFSVGFLPAIAFGVLLALAIRRGGLPTAAERAVVAITAATTFWFVLQAAAFASRFTDRLEERYMVYAAPLLLIVFVLWIARGLPRPLIPTVVAALVSLALVLAIPFERFFNVAIFADSFGVVPVLRLHDHLGNVDDVRLVLAGGGAAAAAACVALSVRVARVALPLAVAGFFLLSAYTLYGALEVQADGARAASGVPDPSWVDNELGGSGQVGFIYTGSLNANPHLLWQTEFWNRSVRGVYVLGTDNFLTFRSPQIALDKRGRLVPNASSPNASVVEPYILAEPTVGIVGDVIAKPGPLALIRAKQPVRIESAVDGVYADGWSGSEASLSQYAPLPRGARRVRVTVSRQAWTGPDVPGRVTVSIGRLRMTPGGPALGQVTAKRDWTVHSGRARAFVLDVPPPPFRLEVQVSPTFTPAEFGFADTRQLGAQVVFAPEPRGQTGR